MADNLNYFVCTLADAVSRNKRHPHKFSTVNALIDQQAEAKRNKPAVAFFRPNDTAPTPYALYTFSDLRDFSLYVATQICNGLDTTSLHGQTIALLARSTPGFLFTWLALMRAGAGVLLLAPELEASAIAHLCKESKSTILIFDPQYAQKADDGASVAGINRLELPFLNPNVYDKFSLPHTHDKGKVWPEVNSHDVAYLHHTSGTSSGLPKLIPQTHHAAVGVLPVFDGSGAATFSTTPLYHGGPADCFRAWSSGAMIWLYPGSTAITAGKIEHTMSLSDQGVAEGRLPPIKYFTSVPMVLKMYAAEDFGIARLKKMNLVGVGGAALADDLGESLMRRGVQLVSRYGSAESGFILSSARDYQQDNAWQYLRPAMKTGLLKFEPREDGLSELVLSKDWPHLAKRNRENGYYATSDLFKPHPTIPNAWRYDSRADAQLTLVTGKKFDPAPVEDSIALDPHLSDVLIFGEGQQYPGALLWRSHPAKSMPAEDVVNAVWSRVETMNQGTQAHARIRKSMLIVLPSDTPPPQKSSKGSLLRKPTVARHQELVDSAYNRPGGVDGSDAKEYGPIPEGGLVPFLQELISRHLEIKGTIPSDADLFGAGVDSITAMFLRSELEKRFGDPSVRTLPTNVIYDCGTIDRLASFLLANGKGENFEWEDEHVVMKELAEKHGSFGSFSTNNINTKMNGTKISKQTFLLTGATGALGAHILDQLLKKNSVAKVVCLVRANDEHEAQKRILASLRDRKRIQVSSSDIRIQCLPADLSNDHLGLKVATYQALLRDVDIIIHAAWAVNFNTRLRSFEKDHIKGVHNLINIALASHKSGSATPRFIFCSSTASVIAAKQQQNEVVETISNNPGDASPLGYSRSKWVAEAICAKAAQEPRLNNLVDVIRIGQLCGDTENGVWNMKEAWPMMWRTSLELGQIPDLGDEPLRWLPLDVAAKCVIKIATRSLLERQRRDNSAHVFHVSREMVPDEPTWNDAISWMQHKSGAQYPLQKVSLPNWIKEIENLDREDPARKLLALWKSRSGEAGDGKYDSETDDDRFDQKQTLRICPEINREGVIDFQFFGKMWDWFLKTGVE